MYNISLFTRAINFACIKHKTQRRKNGDIPYINHPIDVANIIAEAGIYDIDVLCAAVLHDTIQDTQTTTQELEKQFGKQICQIVLECSDDKNLDKAERKRIQIQKAKKASPKAKLVKIADKISNNLDIKNNGAPKNWSEDRINGYYLWSYAVCRNLKGVNQKLDQRIDQLFEMLGVNKIQEEVMQSTLNKYYNYLSNKND